MRAVLQRVTSARVQVGAETVGEIGRGILVLLGVEAGDTLSDAAALADKLAGLRLFEDDAGRMNRDSAAAGGGFLVVSQFTLAASLRKGRRPSFNAAAAPDLAEPLVTAVADHLKRQGFTVAGGRFRAHMEVELVNDGPVTFVLEVQNGKVI